MEENPQVTRDEIHDTYEATYYLTQGAQIVGVRAHRLAAKDADKRGYFDQWIIDMDLIPCRAMRLWRAGKPMVDAVAFKWARIKLKKTIVRILYGH